MPKSIYWIMSDVSTVIIYSAVLWSEYYELLLIMTFPKIFHNHRVVLEYSSLSWSSNISSLIHVLIILLGYHLVVLVLIHKSVCQCDIDSLEKSSLIQLLMLHHQISNIQMLHTHVQSLLVIEQLFHCLFISKEIIHWNWIYGCVIECQHLISRI